MTVGKLYMMPTSPPVRSVLLTEKALGIELEHEVCSIMTGDNLKPEYVKLNPQHTIPMYIDQDGTKICDSHVIMTFLVEKYGKNDSLYPKDLFLRSRVDQRLHFDSGVVWPILRSIMRDYARFGNKPIAEEHVKDVNDAYDFLNKFLDGELYMAGHKVTIADFCGLTSVTAMNNLLPIDEKKYPNITKWLKRLEDLPYYSAHQEGFLKLKEMIDAFKAGST